MPGLELSGEQPERRGARPEADITSASGVVRRSILRLRGAMGSWTEDPIVEEYPLTIYHNDEELVTMLCSPGDERHLVLGFLASEGVIASPADVARITIDMPNGLAWVESLGTRPHATNMFLKRCLTACCGRGRAGLHFANDAHLVHTVESRVRLTPEDIQRHVQSLEELSVTFQATGGVHNGALFASGRIVCFSQDIGRHNVLDKLYGYCLGGGIPMNDLILSFSGRVSSEIVLKVSKMNIPVVIARTAPTSLALGLAEDLGITVIGFARGEDCNVYTHAERILI